MGFFAGEHNGRSEKLKRLAQHPSSSGIMCTHFLLKCALLATNGTSQQKGPGVPRIPGPNSHDAPKGFTGYETP